MFWHHGSNHSDSGLSSFPVQTHAQQPLCFTISFHASAPKEFENEAMQSLCLFFLMLPAVVIEPSVALDGQLAAKSGLLLPKRP